MSKNKQKHGKPQEFEKGQIRELKKELKRKDQEIKQLRKELGYNQNKSTSSKKEKDEYLDQCSECGKGFLKVADLGIRRITTCSLCGYRKVSK